MGISRSTGTAAFGQLTRAPQSLSRVCWSIAGFEELLGPVLEVGMGSLLLESCDCTWLS